MLLCGDKQPQERRDLGVILVHCGLPEQVCHGRGCPFTTLSQACLSPFGLPFKPLVELCLTPLQGMAELRAFAASSYAQQAPPREQHLLGSLLELSQRQPVQMKLKPLSLDLALLEAEPEVDSEVRTPLTW